MTITAVIDEKNIDFYKELSTSFDEDDRQPSHSLAVNYAVSALKALETVIERQVNINDVADFFSAIAEGKVIIVKAK